MVISTVALDGWPVMFGSPLLVPDVTAHPSRTVYQLNIFPYGTITATALSALKKVNCINWCEVREI